MRRLKGKVVGIDNLLRWDRQWGGRMWLEGSAFNDYDVLFKDTVLEFKLADTFEDVYSPYSLYLTTKDVKNVRVS
ncbi:g366 [Yersinia phage phiR1-37]|uniref:hypothetical protein n=1 Tax=Yersinia phage phiR1-37 TaxID=331278 RepID=UPI00022DBE19|nr:hypothetical protein phiR1-37_gp366 [Yersinia phage phiR1-37]CCE26389.1 g366 [Yersinia phage phiR1-37]